MRSSIRVVHLVSSPRENGLYCGPRGLTLAGFPLLTRTGRGFAAKPSSELQHIFNIAFGEYPGIDAGLYTHGLANVAVSLNKGDMPLATISSLMLKLPDLPNAADRLTATSWCGRKHPFDDTEPRDAKGRWTEGVPEARQTPTIETPPDELSPTAPSEEVITAEPLVSRLVRISLRVLALIGELGAAIVDTVPLASVFTLVPINRSNVHSGIFPGFPNLHYVSDEGSLTIIRSDAAGNRETMYRGLPDAEEFYHDPQGAVVGRLVGTGVLFDNGVLATMANPSKRPEEATAPRPDVSMAQTDDEPKICPPPTIESIAGRSVRSLAYQNQFTGLPIGWDVLFNGVRYDGCDSATKNLLEAKGLMGGYLTNARCSNITRQIL